MPDADTYICFLSQGVPQMGRSYNDMLAELGGEGKAAPSGLGEKGSGGPSDEQATKKGEIEERESTFKAAHAAAFAAESLAARAKAAADIVIGKIPKLTCPEGSCYSVTEKHQLGKCTLGSSLTALSCPENTFMSITTIGSVVNCTNCNSGFSCNIEKGQCTDGETGWTCGGCKWSNPGSASCTDCPRYTMPRTDPKVLYTSANPWQGTDSDTRINMYVRAKGALPCTKKCGECAAEVWDPYQNRMQDSCMNVARHNDVIREAQSGVQKHIYSGCVLNSTAAPELRARRATGAAQLFQLNDKLKQFPGIEPPPHAASKQIAIRCCKAETSGGVDDSLQCVSKHDFESVDDKCLGMSKSYEEAEAMCSKMEMELCTKAQVDTGKCCEEPAAEPNAPCGYNENYIWVKDPVQDSTAPIAKPIMTSATNSKITSTFYADVTQDSEECQFKSEEKVQAEAAVVTAEQFITGNEPSWEHNFGRVNGPLTKGCVWKKTAPFITAPTVDCGCGNVKEEGCTEDGFEYASCTLPTTLGDISCPLTAGTSSGSAFTACTNCNEDNKCEFSTFEQNCGPDGCYGCKRGKMSTVWIGQTDCKDCAMLTTSQNSVAKSIFASTHYKAPLGNKDSRLRTMTERCWEQCGECRHSIRDGNGEIQEDWCVNIYRANHNYPTQSIAKPTKDDDVCQIQKR